MISSPLEQLPESPKTPEEAMLMLPSPSGTVVEPITTEMKAKDLKQGLVSVKIPQVILRRESLSHLCDVLMNDLCTKRVFSNITSTISRLAKIAKNNAILLDLIYEVIIDMSDQSQSKMNQLSHYLHDVQARYVEAARVDGMAKSTSTSSSLKSVKFADTSKLPCSLLPLGESGGRQHDRLLRVVQTLQSMAAKTNRNLLEVMPVEQLTSLWSTLEAVLTHLRSYLADNDEDKDGTETIRPQTTLTSILNRLLPVIEAFFLVHTHDLLAVEKAPAASATTTSTTGEAGATATTTPAPSDSAAAPSTSAPPPSNELISPAAMPGYKYRTTPQYLRNNLSLYADGTGADIGLTSVRSLRKQSSFTSTSSVRGNIPARSQKLLSFAQAHKGVLNLIIKSKPALLETSFSAFVRITQLRSLLKFDNKRKYFFTQLKKANQSVSRRGVHLQIRRNQVFEDTFHQMRVRTAEELRGRLQVNFYNEEGVDAGGLTREWYVILSREIFNPNYALFLAAADGATFQPNPFSMINTNHLDYFKFVGRIIGKAICDGQLMDAHFTRSFYKHLLGMPVDFTDIEATEPDYYKTLKQILETPLDLLMMDLTFSAENQKFGSTEVMDLIPNGRNIAVTDENKADYIRLIAHHRMTSAIRSQIDSFLNGFYDLVPPELISIFSPAELELLICGLPDVNIDELQANTEYHQYKATDDVIVWFWEELRSYNREERASFLQFVTGTSKVPLGGFANLQGMRGNQRFSIHRAYGDTGLLPTAHTCFNQLDLPAYATQKELKEKLALAVNEGSEGFGFA